MSGYQQLSAQFLVSNHKTIHILWKFRDLIELSLDIITTCYLTRLNFRKVKRHSAQTASNWIF